jgi:hypothetical protein
MPAGTGVAACLIGAVCGLLALIFWTAQVFAKFQPSRFTDPALWLSLAVILYGFALLWGNVGILFTHAGFTG